MKIALIPNVRKDTSLSVSKDAAKILSERGCTVYSPESLPFAARCPVEEAVSLSDLVLTVGGDGTILHTAHVAVRHHKPIFGINLGRVGFMAELEPKELSLLELLPKGEFITEKRMMLSCEVLRKGKSVFSALCLNDAVISKGAVSRMIEFDVFSGEDLIHSYRADGIVFASPTGSTAYSLSAGGPVVDPTVNCIVATPICVPSFFAARPVIFSKKTVLSIRMKTEDDTPAFLTADGIDNFPLERDDTVMIRRAKETLSLLRLKSDSFYSLLSKKIK